MIQEHGSQRQIQRWASGLATREEMREVVRHLLQGCDGCGHEVAAAFGLLRPEGVADYGAVVRASCDRLRSRRRTFARERLAAAGQWAYLQRLEPAQRAAAIRHDRSLQTLGLFERLLAAGEAGAGREPATGEEIAHLALLLVDHLEPTVSERVRADLRAEAWGEVARARRGGADLADLRGAGAAMAEAWGHYRRGSQTLDLEAPLLRLDAALLVAAGELEAAERTLSEVVSIYRRLKDDRLQGQALFELGQAAGQLDAARGVALLEQSLRLLRRAGDVRCELAAHHHCAWFLTEAGRCEEASALLARSRRLEAGAGGDDSQFRRLWLEGRIAFRLGDGGGAQIIFKHLLALAQGRRMRKELVLVGLDLAAAYAAAGADDECAGLLGFLYPLLVEWRLHLDALETWDRLQKETTRRRPEAERVLRVAARYYLRYWEQPPRQGGKRLPS
jgi:hypothetical protein